VQATLKQRGEEVSRLDGELNQLSVSHEDLRQSLEEQEAMVLILRQAVEDACKALDSEKKQVEGESPLSTFRVLFCFTWDPLPT
jgi:predicted transcriptional regulator